MAKSAELSDEIPATVREAAERCGAFDRSRIAAALNGMIDTTQLREDEEKAWLDAFAAKMARPTKGEEAFFARRQALGRGVGLDARGNLVNCGDDGSA